jgi:hypothetical protein
MIFKSRVDIAFKCLVFGLIFLMVYAIVVSWMDSSMVTALKFWLTFLLVVLSGFMLWIYRQTSYEITPEELKYQFGPLVGKIKIDRIHSLEVNKTLWAGTNKPATALKGIIVKYNKFDEIYISPSTNETFVEELLKVKPDIQVNLH